MKIVAEITFEPVIGAHLIDVLADAKALAEYGGCDVRFEFNGREFVLTQYDSIGRLYDLNHLAQMGAKT